MAIQLFVYRTETAQQDPVPRVYGLRPFDDDTYKPSGGLFTSTYRAKGRTASDWVRWAAEDRPDWIQGPRFLLYPSGNARIFTIDSTEDARTLRDRFPGERGLRTSFYVNWFDVAEEYDAVHLTSRGVGVTRFPEDESLSLNGWDVESTVWFADVFDRIEPYEGKLVRGAS